MEHIRSSIILIKGIPMLLKYWVCRDGKLKRLNLLAWSINQLLMELPNEQLLAEGCCSKVTLRLVCFVTNYPDYSEELISPSLVIFVSGLQFMNLFNL